MRAQHFPFRIARLREQPSNFVWIGRCVCQAVANNQQAELIFLARIRACHADVRLGGCDGFAGFRLQRDCQGMYANVGRRRRERPAITVNLSYIAFDGKRMPLRCGHDGIAKIDIRLIPNDGVAFLR